jgi:hypothetical protein
VSEARIMQSGDAAESFILAYWPDVAARMEGIESKEFAELVQNYEKELETYGRIIAAETIRRAFLEIAKSDNPLLSMYAFFVAMGFNQIVPESLQKIGDKLDVTKQAVDKQVTFYRDLFAGRPLGSAKSEETRETLREVQIDRYNQANQQTEKQPNNGFTFRDFYTN